MALNIDNIIASLEDELLGERFSVALYKSFLSDKQWADERLGLTKKIYNLLERIHGLELLKVAQGTNVLYDTAVWGFESMVNGKTVRLPLDEVPGLRGRIFDCFQYAGQAGMGVELKSGSTLIKSIKGGLSNSEIETLFRTRTALAKQLKNELQIIRYATNRGLRIVFSGRDVATGAWTTITLEAEKIASTRVTTYRALPDKLLTAPIVDLASKVPANIVTGATNPDTAKRSLPVKLMAVNPQEAARGKAARGIDTAPGENTAVQRGVATEGEQATAKRLEGTVVRKTGDVAAQDIATRRSLLPRIKFHPKLRALLFSLLEDGLFILAEIFVQWLKNKEFNGILKRLNEKVKVEMDQLALSDNSFSEFNKFRTGENFNNGYQLYYRVAFNLIRPGTVVYDGRNATNYGTGDTKILFVGLTRKSGADFLPEYDPDEDDSYKLGGQYVKSSGQFYIPIFDTGMPMNNAAEDAADEKFQVISSITTANAFSWMYLRDFYEYVKLFPTSDAARTWAQLSSTHYFEMLLIGTGIYGYIDVRILRGYPFGTLMEMIKWFANSDVSFIRSYQKYINNLPPGKKELVPPISKKYLDRLRTDRMTAYNCHTGDNTFVPINIPDIDDIVEKKDVIPPARKPAFRGKENTMCTTDCHAPNDRGVADPLMGVFKKVTPD